MNSEPQPSPSPLSLRRVLRFVGIAAAVVSLGLVVLWVAIHRVPWLGPALADGVRAIVGPVPVAWAEDVAYGWQDRINQWRHGEDAPRTYWSMPEEGNPTPESPIVEAPKTMDESESFPPKPFEPPHERVAAPGDGTWAPIGGRATYGQTPVMVKTMVHPDVERPYAVLALVAMDLSKIRLHAAAGQGEPRDPSFPMNLRSGTVPADKLDSVIAAFNGGFQTIHGGYGMMVDGHPIGQPKEEACTVGLYADGTIRIRSWPELEPDVGAMAAYRQTPPCLVEQGQRHPDLVNRYNTSWGAVVNGKTLIRRSALGISKDAKVLFFGMGDSLTARTIADGMMAARAHDVAQLDVNHVFPRFVFIGEVKGNTEAVEPLCRGFSFSRHDYVSVPMVRDFFYVTSRNSEMTGAEP